jgi:hypothetical protein
MEVCDFSIMNNLCFRVLLKKHRKRVEMGVSYDDCCCVVKLKERKKQRKIERKKEGKKGSKLQVLGSDSRARCSALLCGCVALGVYWYVNLKRSVFVTLLKAIDLRAGQCIHRLSLSVSSWNNVRVIVRRQVAREMQNWTTELNKFLELYDLRFPQLWLWRVLSFFLGKTLCSLLKVNRRFGDTSPISSGWLAEPSSCHLLLFWFFAWSISDPENWGHNFLRNICWLSTDSTA